MTSEIKINDKKLLPIKEVISEVDYSRDYVTRLARERKIVATQIGRKWFVELESLKNYQEVAKLEQEIKQQQLSDDRKRELAIKAQKESKRSQSEQFIQKPTAAIVTACVAVVFGLGLGVLLESEYRAGFSSLAQMANVKSVFTTAESDPYDLEAFSLEGETVMVPTFVPNVSTRELTAEEGLLLLPDKATSAVEVQDYFSDPVTVRFDEAGRRSVIRIDETGAPTGDEIPFVIVPINERSP